MRKSILAVPVLLALCLACSGSGSGSGHTSPPPPPLADNSLREVLLGLGKKRCSLRPNASNSHWVLEFKSGGATKNFEVERVGTDFVRLTEGRVRYDLPFSSIVLVTSDD